MTNLSHGRRIHVRNGKIRFHGEGALNEKLHSTIL
jgi:hypothetical protein